MIFLKDANLLQLFAAYTLLIGHSEKNVTIIDYIKYRPTSSSQADITTVLNGYKETSTDILHYILDRELPNITLLEAAQAKRSYYLDEAIIAIVCECYSKKEDFELIYHLEGEGKFKLEIGGLESNIHDAREIMKELGYDKWRIWSY